MHLIAPFLPSSSDPLQTTREGGHRSNIATPAKGALIARIRSYTSVKPGCFSLSEHDLQQKPNNSLTATVGVKFLQN